MTKGQPKKTAVEAASEQNSSYVTLSTGVKVHDVVEVMWPWKGGTIQINLDCTSGEPALLEFKIKAKPYGRGIPASALSLENVNRFIDRAIAVDAVEVVFELLEADGSRPVSLEFLDLLPEMETEPGVVPVENDLVDDLRHRAVTASRKARNQGGRPPTTDERKLEIAEAYRNRGIEAAMELSGAKERWTRELVRQGKELRKQMKGEG